ncbi:MAG: type I-D CRISPR-associated protein Cas5/Csc1 [Desulfobacterales bacterium]|nr:type I-D CRISPR-associated protein Cas5/Csc1 [Desulfobacterales bacterium]
MSPNLYQLEIELHEATFFASHELDAIYFTEPVIGNYALAYALGLVKSPYDRYDVGYAEDLPSLNKKGTYIYPAWSCNKPKYKIERFNCQAESFNSGMTNNAVAEVAGRQYLMREGTSLFEGSTGKQIRANNRPQTGIIKFLSPLNRFLSHIISNEELKLPRYIRLGKFMSKAKIKYKKIEVTEQKFMKSEYSLINPVDINPETKILFGDTINIHPVPLIRKAEIEGYWWIDNKNKPIVPSGMEFRGF